MPNTRDLVKNEDASVTLAWMDLYLQFDQYTNNFRPGPTARALAYINFAAYESVMKGMPDFNSVGGLYSGLSIPEMSSGEHHFPTVLNTIYANLFKRFLPVEHIQADQQSKLQFDILVLEDDFNEAYNAIIETAVYERSVAHGEEVADAIWEWSKTDPFGYQGYDNARPDGYTPPTGPGIWEPTAPDFSKALFPYWGNVRTFAISQTDKLAEEPMVFAEEMTSPFYVQALEIRNAGNNLEFNDQWVAETWNDEDVGKSFSPVARWISITLQILEGDECHLETALYALAKVSMAMHDGCVSAWHSKYTYNVERPVSYINRVIDNDWAPYIATTPSTPSYPSSHATISAAAADVLSHVFGYAYGMTDASHEGETDFLGMPRDYDTFYQMAGESAASRLSAGVHFRMDIEEGLLLGYKIGRKVNALPFR